MLRAILTFLERAARALAHSLQSFLLVVERHTMATKLITQFSY